MVKARIGDRLDVDAFIAAEKTEKTAFGSLSLVEKWQQVKEWAVEHGHMPFFPIEECRHGCLASRVPPLRMLTGAHRECRRVSVRSMLGLLGF